MGEARDLVILEEYLQSKSGDPRGGQDRLVRGPRYFGVVDGATSKSGQEWLPGKTGGEVVAEVVAGILSQPDCPEDPIELVIKLNEGIQAAASAAGIDLTDPGNLADAAFAAYVPSRYEVFHINDCSFGFVLRDGTFDPHLIGKTVDELTSELRARVIAFLRSHDVDPFEGGRDRGREFIHPMLASQGELQNLDPDVAGDWFGIPKRLVAYNTLNGMPTEVSVTPVPEGTASIVLASDGFPELKPTLDASLAALRSLLKEDPHCIDRLRSTKGVRAGCETYDDMSYMRVRCG